MSERLPDEYFRQTTSESSDAGTASPGGVSSVSSRARHRLLRRVSPRLVVAGCVAAVLVGVFGTRLLIQENTESAAPTPSPSATSAIDLTPYDGPVSPAPVSAATGQCSQGGEDQSSALLDDRPDTIWRCPGAGVGATVTFTFQPGTELVGVRLVNGDTTGQSYQEGRRIMAVRWTFSDGSWAVQPLGANHPEDQEVRFPPVVTDDVIMTVLSTTEPGSPEPDANAVAVSRVEFLSRG